MCIYSEFKKDEGANELAILLDLLGLYLTLNQINSRPILNTSAIKN